MKPDIATNQNVLKKANKGTKRRASYSGKFKVEVAKFAKETKYSLAADQYHVHEETIR